MKVKDFKPGQVFELYGQYFIIDSNKTIYELTLDKRYDISNSIDCKPVSLEYAISQLLTIFDSVDYTDSYSWESY